MKVSIIVPIYNVEKEIERCLASILNQDYMDLELILVNDCSPDRSFEVAQSFIKIHAFEAQTKYVNHSVNRGLSIARNSGIEIADGDYLFFLDSDDALAEKNAITSMIEGAIQIDKNLPQIIVGNRWVEGDSKPRAMPEALYVNNDEIYNAYLQSDFSIIACGKLIQKQFLIDHNLYFVPGIYHEDELWWFKVCRVAERVYITPYIVLNIYDREGSITSSITQRHAADWVTIVLAMAQEYHKRPNYYAKETVRWIEAVKWKCIQRLYLFNDRDFLCAQIARLQSLRLPFWKTGKTSIIKLNLLMKLPTKFVVWYLALKMKKSKYQFPKSAL